jgi:hypothetical protein
LEWPETSVNDIPMKLEPAALSTSSEALVGGSGVDVGGDC